MSIEMVVSIVSALACLTTIAAYFNGKIKDAEENGKLKQRVSDLEKQQIKNEATKEDINSLLMAIGKITGQIESLQKSVEELKQDMKCIERRRE